MPNFLKRGIRGLYVDERSPLPPPTIDEMLDTIEVPRSMAMKIFENRGFGIKHPTMRLYETLVLYYESCPSPVTRGDIEQVLSQWRSYVTDHLAACPPADGSLVQATMTWLDKNIDDVDEDLSDALELFQRRKKIGPYARR
jgi:hypothetical protein